MSDSPQDDRPHLVSLVLTSKKALLHAQNLCSRANELSQSSSKLVVDVLGLDAKLRWLSDAVLEQLRLSATVANNIAQQRAKLEADGRELDAIRTERVKSLDAVLESLGNQPVHPSLYNDLSNSSLFGSQHSDIIQNSSRSRIRRSVDESVASNKKESWKSLRDFAVEREIEEVIERIDEDRSILEDLLARTSTYPADLMKQITSLQALLPPPIPPPPLEPLLTEQESISTYMAEHLSSLTTHYDQMADALREEEEAGITLDEENMQVLTRDTEELPSVISELEDLATSIESINDKLAAAVQASRDSLDKYPSVMTSLEELGEIMGAMLEDQRRVEADAATLQTTMRERIGELINLEEKYLSWKTAYNHLVLEMDRRRSHYDAMESFVREFTAQLEQYRTDEIRAREAFYTTQGQFLPDDLSGRVSELPSTWSVERHGEDVGEFVAESVVHEARESLATEGHAV